MRVTSISGTALLVSWPAVLPCVADFARAKFGIVVLTTATAEDIHGDSYSSRVHTAHATWARGQPVLFIAAQENAALGIEAVSCDDSHMEGMCCKTVAGFQLALQRFPHADWFLRVSDDSFVFTDHLSQVLRAFNPAEKLFLGSTALTLLCHFALHSGACVEPHAGGGSGFILSRAVAELIAVEHPGLFLESCQHDDVHLGHFLRHAFDVHAINLPGVLQEPRITKVNLNASGHGRLHSAAELAVPRCPDPHPPAVYSRLDDYGPVNPIAPVGWGQMLLLHSDPSIWPTLVLLNAWHRPPVDELLVYLDSGGRRILGPHFEGVDTLGVCLLRAADRLSTFRGAATRSVDSVEPLPVVASLHWAAQQGHVALVRQLVGARSNVNHMVQKCPIQEWFAPLHFAAMAGHIAVVDALLEANADPAPRSPLGSLTPADVAEMALPSHHPMRRHLIGIESN